MAEKPTSDAPRDDHGTRHDAIARRLRVSQLNPRSPTPINLAPDAGQRAAIAGELGLVALPALTLTGAVSPAAHGAWELSATLRARVVQRCVATLAPVETKLTEDVRRVYSPNLSPVRAEEQEMPDPDIEPLGQVIDPAAVMIEALALALPEYPRSPAALGDATTTLDAAADPAKDDVNDTRKPFAGLADLLGKPSKG